MSHISIIAVSMEQEAFKEAKRKALQQEHRYSY
jgi:hypothetical protein